MFYAPTRTIKERNEDHTEYMASRPFMRVTEMFASHDPTPAVRPKGGTLSSAGGPCLSGASWSALRRLASLLFNEARRGVSGFGSFCRNKRASPAGAKPGYTTNRLVAHGRCLVERIISKSIPARWHNPRKTRMQQTF